jgi:hypothetical protein
MIITGMLVLPGIEKLALLSHPVTKYLHENPHLKETLEIAWRSSWEV